MKLHVTAFMGQYKKNLSMLKELLENGTNRKLSQSKGHRNKHCVSPLEQFNHSN